MHAILLFCPPLYIINNIFYCGSIYCLLVLNIVDKQSVFITHLIEIKIIDKRKKMKVNLFEKFINPFLWFYFILGQNSYVPLTLFHRCDRQRRTYKNQMIINVLEKIPILIYFIIGITTGIISRIDVLYYNGKFGNTNLYLAYLYIIIACQTNFIIIIQQLIYRKTYLSIINRYEKINYYFDNYLEKILNWKLIKNQIRNHLLIIILLDLLSFIILYIGTFITSEQLFSLPLSLLQLITQLIFVHFIFFVKLLYFILNNLTANLKLLSIKTRTPTKTTTATTTKIINNKNLKKNIDYKTQIQICYQIYLSIWKIANKLDKYFGWGLLSIFVQRFIDIAYDSYLLFGFFMWSVSDFDAVYKIIRMYILFCLVFCF